MRAALVKMVKTNYPDEEHLKHKTHFADNWYVIPDPTEDQIEQARAALRAVSDFETEEKNG
jgi:hypothetical protein